MTGHRDPAFLAMELLAELENAGYDVSDDLVPVTADETASDIVARWMRELLNENAQRLTSSVEAPGAIALPDRDPVTVLSLAGAVEEQFYRDQWVDVSREAGAYHAAPEGGTRSLVTSARMRDGREVKVVITEFGLDTPDCSAVLESGGNLCVRPRGHGGLHLGDGAAWSDANNGPCASTFYRGRHRCTLYAGHDGVHRDENASWMDVAADRVSSPEQIFLDRLQMPAPDPVLEQLIREEEEIERRVAERPRASEALYRCDGCGHHGFTIRMCPRCNGTDTVAREER